MNRNSYTAALAVVAAGIILTASTFTQTTPAANQGAAAALAGPYGGSSDDGYCARYAAGTSREYIAQWEAEFFGNMQAFINGGRWNVTSTDGPTGSPGTPITLTYSFVPDGNVSQFGGTNRIHETFDAQFGSTTTWKAKFREGFDLWEAVSGMTFIEVSDDNAPDRSPGQIGARGDIRIRAERLDGAFGVLAFGFFPDAGDITFDIDEAWNDPTNNFRFFISTLDHEAGHTFGMEHVGPSNGTKLMEPFDNENLREPLDDDIRGVNANYGDTMELNDTLGSAADLGAYSPGTVFGGLALVGADEDWFSFSAGSGQLVAASARPIGGTYLVGPDGGPFSSISTQSIMPLGIEIYDQSGVELLRTTVNTVAGNAASSVPVAVPDGDSQFLVRVFSEGSGDVQRYELALPSAVSEPAILSIESVGAEAIAVSASPADGLGVSMVTSPGELIFARGQSVTLSVPDSADGVQFIQWLIGDDAQTPGQTEATFAVSGDTTITAIFADAPIIDAGTDKTIVVGESVQLQGSATGGAPPYTFSWLPSGGVTGGNTSTPTVSPNESTEYTMKVVDSNGTTVLDTVRVEVLPALRANAGANQFTVVGGSFTLTGSATGGVEPYSYAWTPAAPLISANQATTRGSLAETTDFTLTVTDADGRTADSVVKTVVVGSIIVDAGDDTQIRPGQSIRLTTRISGGLPPYSVQWTPAFLTTPVTTRSVLVNPGEDTAFNVLVTDSLGQESSDEVSVFLATPLEVVASARPESVLLGESTTLIGAVSGGVPPFEFTWGPDDEVATPAESQTQLTPSVTRTYGLNVRDSVGQTGAASIRVVVVRPERSLNTQSALQTPGATGAAPALVPTCGVGLLGAVPFMVLSLIPFRRRLSRRRDT